METDISLAGLVKSSAEKYPESVFLESTAGEALTYSQAHCTAIDYANALKQLGVSENNCIAVMLPQGIEAVLFWLACIWLRAWRVVVDVAEGFEGEALEGVIVNCQAKILIIESKFLGKLESIDLDKTEIGTIVVVGSSSEPFSSCSNHVRFLSKHEFLCGITADFEPSQPRHNDVASITPTSGTTDTPKCAVLHWPYFYAFLEPGPNKLPREHESSLYVPFPASWAPGQTSIYQAAAVGCKVIVREYIKFDEYVSDIIKHQCTHAFIPQSIAHNMMNLPKRDYEQLSLENVCLIGGLPVAVEEFKRRFGIKNMIYGYGMTEIGFPITGKDLSKVAKPGLCGYPHSDYELRIVNREDEPLGPNEVGELVIRSKRPWTLATQYYRRYAETIAANRNNWFHTGDAFFFDDDGTFFFVDRYEDLIHTRQGPISSRYLETVINSHPAVLQSAVIGIKALDGYEDLKLFIQFRMGFSLQTNEILDHILSSGPTSSIPRWLEIVEKLPRTASQKIKKSVLRKMDNGPDTIEVNKTELVYTT